MNLISSLLPLGNSRDASAFYSKSPFRDNVFLGTSFMLLADIAVAAVILIKDWNRTPARIVFYVAVVLFGLISLWKWALRGHKDVQGLIASSEGGQLGEPSQVRRALSVSANMTYLALFYTFLLVGICLMALGEAL